MLFEVWEWLERSKERFTVVNFEIGWVYYSGNAFLIKEDKYGKSCD